MENRNALIVDIELTQADGYAERATALEMLGRLPRRRRRRTVAADKTYDTAGFVADCRASGSPRTSPRTRRTGVPRSAVAPPATPGHRTSQRMRSRIEEPFGWIKTIARRCRLRYRGRERNRAWFLLAGATCNILRITAVETQTT